jgi:hypothetical protein
VEQGGDVVDAPGEDEGRRDEDILDPLMGSRGFQDGGYHVTKWAGVYPKPDAG